MTASVLVSMVPSLAGSVGARLTWVDAVDAMRSAVREMLRSLHAMRNTASISLAELGVCAYDGVGVSD